MGVPVKYYTFVDGQTPAGLITADRLNGNLDALFNALDPAADGLEDTNVKAGAKIVCSDRNYAGAAKITGSWEFDVFPTVPDGSIPATKLGSGVNADMVDSLHAADLAPAAKGVTNGDTHDHVGGDGAAIPEGGLSLTDVATGNVDTLRHGLCPKLPDTTTDFLRGDGTWAVPGVDLGYTFSPMAGEFSPSDAGTYYAGCHPSIGTIPALRRMYIPKAGVITVAYLYWYAAGEAGTSESVSVYIRKNNTDDTLVATIGNAEVSKVFSKTDLEIAVAQGDYIEMKIVCPTWATNPTNVYLTGVVYVTKAAETGGGATGIPDIGAVEYQG